MNKESKIILCLAVLLAFVIGSVCGYFIGENRAQESFSNKFIAETKSSSSNSDEDASSEPSAPSVDYTQYIINEEQGVTIEDFYPDEEGKDIASKIIGTTIPSMKWTDASGTEQDTAKMTGNYIVEIFSPSCTFCKQSAPEVESFVEAHPKLPLVSLTTTDGDISEFGAQAFKMSNASDSNVNKFLSNVPWVPTFLFVQDGNVKLITFGGVSVDSLKQYTTLAFGTDALN